MNFSTDRDLLALAPEVFTDAPLVGQTRIDVADGILAGTALTSAAADFAAAGVEAGGVVLIAQTPFEVVERVDANTLTVSLPRARTTDAALTAPHLDGSALAVRVRTFAPQAALIHDALLRMLGLSPDPDAELGEDAVVSLSAMARLEALGTLDLVYAGAAALTGDATHDANLARKAAHHRARFVAARRAARITIDTNADGLGDEVRRPGLLCLHRV